MKTWFHLLPLHSPVRAILLVFSNFLFSVCTKMSNRPAQEESIDGSDAALSWSRIKQTLHLILPITLSFCTDKSILKGELACTVMKIRVIGLLFDLKSYLMGQTKTLQLSNPEVKI